MSEKNKAALRDLGVVDVHGAVQAASDMLTQVSQGHGAGVKSFPRATGGRAVGAPRRNRRARSKNFVGARPAEVGG